VIAGLSLPTRTDVAFAPTARALAEIPTASFAVSLIYVSYAFSGWNAAAYIVGELKDPQRTLPRAMLHATLLVTVLYLALNWTFLRAVPIAELAGKVEVGGLAATAMFGASGGRLMNGMIAFVLLSAVSAMTFAGPRIVHTVGEDLPALAFLARRTPAGVPRNALLLQQGIALLFILTGTFEPVLTYAGFTMNLLSLLVVAGVFVMRRREPDLPRPYKAWGYPVTPAIFVALSAWTLTYVAIAKPTEALYGVLTLASGLLLLVFRRRAA
jgi:APA family basic amino acid/polyamine antiporter